MKTKYLSSSCVVSRFITLFILLASLLVLPKINAALEDTFTKDKLIYQVTKEDQASKTGTVTLFRTDNEIPSELPSDVTVPASVFNGGFTYSVTLIRYGAFSRFNNLKSVVIPDSVTSIGERAFNGCINLRSVTIGKSVTSIGKWAFQNCSSLTNIIIPDSVTSIGETAFMGCSGLTEIIVGENNPNFSCLHGVLFNKDQTTLIQFPGGKKGIYTIPDRVTSIGERAFQDCISLTSVVIPDSVTSIGEMAFMGCSGLTEIIVGENNPNFSCLHGVLFNKDQTTLIQFPGGKKGIYKIPDSVSSIGENAFARCSGLKNVIIAKSVTAIGDGAFYGCVKLESVIIPDSVTSIGNSAFANCSSLANATVGKGVTSIMDGAFAECGSLTGITIPDSITSMGVGVFLECTSLATIIIPDSVTSIGAGFFAGCSSLTEITVGENNPNFSCLHGVLFNKDQTTLIQFPIGKKGIYTIPDGVTFIGEMAFAGCSGLTSIVIPDSVTKIGEGAFAECNGLESVTLGKGVASIGKEAFRNCGKLTAVYFKGDAPNLPEGDAFFKPSVIHYKPGTTGWKNPWDGRPTKEWVE